VIVDKQITGDIIVIRDTQYNNFIGENIIVDENTIGRFYGVINKSLLLRKGAIAYLHGKLHGKFINEGGILYLFPASGKVETHTDSF
jgi:hypothetical protein